MAERVNIEAKNQLAKLLASEDLSIRHAQVETGSFDMVNRILTFPMWEEMSDNLYTLLCGHEVAHALYSYEMEKGKRVNRSALYYAEKIDPNNIIVAKGYWNVVVDARDERLVKGPYPGLKSVFAKGYEELTEKGFFSVHKDDIPSLPLIDRLNMYFKAGHLFLVPFSDEERELLRKVSETITMDDVVEVAKEIYQWSQANELQPLPPITLQMTMDELKKFLEKNPQPKDKPKGPCQKIIVEVTDAEPEESDSDDDGEPCDGSGGENDESDDESDDESKPGKGKGKGKGKSKPKDGDDEDGDKNEDGDGSGSGKDDSDGDDGDDTDGDPSDSGDDSDEPDDEPSDDDKDKSKTSKNGKTPGNGREFTKPVDPGPPPASITATDIEKTIQKLIDPNAKETVYVSIPTPDLKKIIVEWKEVHANIHKHFRKPHLEAAQRAYGEFRNENMQKINYILQQFEMKKQADRYKRTRQHKSGSLDTLRLHAYKTEEDLFKTIAICADGKNHGLIYVVDWSASMSGNMAGTLEQLIVLCLFCRKAQIPFEVYSLTTGGTNTFSHLPGQLVYANNFSMRQYLSSSMTPKEFEAACVNLFALMPGGIFAGGPTKDNLIGCTPLNEAITASIDIIKDFRTKRNIQVVNAIFLTDGGANTVSEYYDATGRAQSMYSGYSGYSYSYLGRSSEKNFVIEDRLTRKAYKFETNEMTPTLVKILKDRNNIHAVCFYIDGSWNMFYKNLDPNKQVMLQKQFEENGYVVCTEWGFDELYITRRSDVGRVKDIKLKPQKIKPGSVEYVEAAQKNLALQGKMLMKQRIMLDRFVAMIA